MSIKGMEFDNILLTHGHAMPKIGKNIEKIITGHLHSILIKEGSKINGQRVWIRIILKNSEHKERKEDENGLIVFEEIKDEQQITNISSNKDAITMDFTPTIGKRLNF